MSVAGTTATTSNTPLATMTVTLAKKLTNVMDVGMVEFTITPKAYDFGATSLAYISFPTYYNPSIGDMMRCSLYDATAKKDKDRLYCAVSWCYTLRVMGPATAVKKDAAFVLRVYGVNMNTYATKGKFGVGLTNQTYWDSHTQVNEFNTVDDAATAGKWSAVLPLDVSSVTLSSSVMRSSSDITVAFALPATTGTVLNDGDYVAMQLPYQWMGVAGWMDGSVTPSASLKSVVVTGTGTTAKTTKTTVKGAVTMVSGCNLVFQLDATATKLAEQKADDTTVNSYEFVVSGVPTAENAALAK
jgi:hypothetical protein